MSELPQLPQPPRCMHLQSKSMAVYGEGFEGDPDYEGGVADFWCVQTGRALGPDDAPAGIPYCRDPDRGCYQEY